MIPVADNDSFVQLRRMVHSALMAALTAVGALVAIPIPGIPVPIVLQNFFVFLSGLLLGKSWGTASVAVYLLAGACGLPVFAGGTGGIGRLVGPTGGFLVGFLGGVYVIGWVAGGGRKPTVFRDVAAMVCGTVVIYALGVAWLCVQTGSSLLPTLVAMLPFAAGDALKIAAAVPVARTLRPIVYGSGIQPS
jgi:biotin transport system substrate-specific component